MSCKDVFRFGHHVICTHVIPFPPALRLSTTMSGMSLRMAALIAGVAGVSEFESEFEDEGEEEEEEEEEEE
jgi:hypothetical protein